MSVTREISSPSVCTCVIEDCWVTPDWNEKSFCVSLRVLTIQRCGIAASRVYINFSKNYINHSSHLLQNELRYYNSEMSFRMAALVLPRRFSSRSISPDRWSSIAWRSSPSSLGNFCFNLDLATFQSSILVCLCYKGAVVWPDWFTSMKRFVTYFT